MRLRQTVAFLQGDRKFPISALTQPTAETQTAASSVNQPLVWLQLASGYCGDLEKFLVSVNLDGILVTNWNCWRYPHYVLLQLARELLFGAVSVTCNQNPAVLRPPN